LIRATGGGLLGRMISKRLGVVTTTLISLMTTLHAESYWVYIGTYTAPGKSEGVYGVSFDSITGKAGKPFLAAKSPSPSFLATHPTGRYLYSANELGEFQGKPAGAVSAFRIDHETGRLELINQVSSGGGGPCHVAVDKTGKVAAVANYGGGSLASFLIRNDGSLSEPVTFIQRTGSGPDKARQEGSHAHCVVFTPDNRRLLAADLGTDEVAEYDVDASTGALTAHAPASVKLPGGSGPRHLVFGVDGKRFWVANEMFYTVAECTYSESDGAMSVGKILPMLEGPFAGQNSAAEIGISPDGRHVYASNRGHNSLAIYDTSHGGFERIGVQSLTVKIPRSFALDPLGNWLWAAGQDSDRVAIHPVDPATGKFSAPVATLTVGAPVCVVFQRAR
jgi:6-phosphogluconolactonase